MPHVHLKGPLTPEDVWLAFDPVQFEEDGSHMKVTDAYLSHDKQMLILRCTVVEKGFPKNFFSKLISKDGQMLLSLESLAYTERTDMVKRLLGLCAWKLMQVEPQLQVTKTNITDFIVPPREA